MNPLTADYKEITDNLAASSRLRSTGHPAPEEILDCTSNDYMAIGADEALRREFLRTLSPDDRFGSGASRLLFTGRDGAYESLEQLLGELYGRPALLYNSGYHCNVGTVSALALPGTLIVADKLVHASILDGIRLSGAPMKRFRHNDIASLVKILKQNAGLFRRVLLIVESVYSMDGDCAPLREIAALKELYPNMMLYVDEAHAFGVCGPRGLGLSEELGLLSEVDILVGTLSKAAASSGAFVIAEEPLRTFLVNTARSLIFSTALPPIAARWSEFVIRHMTGMSRQRRQLALTGEEISAHIASLTGFSAVRSTPIVPLTIGGNERVVRAAEIMRDCGVLALPIRRPTVAEGTERIRISLNASMSEEEINRLKYAATEAARMLLA